MGQSADRKDRPIASAPRAKPASTEVIDVAASLRRMGNNHELFSEVVGIYDEDSPQLMERIRDAVREGDADRLHRAAHSLKGLVSNFGASAAAEAAYVLESMGIRRNLSGSEEGLRALELQLGQLSKALEPFGRRAPL